MKAYTLILNKTFLGNDLEDQIYYFRVDYQYMMNFSKSIGEDNFISLIQAEFEIFHQDFKKILTKFEENGIKFEYDPDSQVWQDSLHNLTISNKGVLKEVSDFTNAYSSIMNIKKEVLKEGIFLKIVNYVH